jgi:alpha-glucosidase
VRDLIALRREHANLRGGDYETLSAPDGVWAWRRGDGFAVAINLGDAEASVEGLDGTIAIATDRARDGETVTGALRLAASEGVLLELSR